LNTLPQHIFIFDEFERYTTMKTVNHVRLTPDDMEKVIPTPHLNLGGIIEDACYRPKAGHPYLLFSCHVENYRNRKCPFCDSTAVHAHGQTGAPRRIHDVNSGRTKVDIDLQVQRYICSECGKSFSNLPPDIMEGRHLTKRLYDEIRHEAFTKPLSTVAMKYGYSDTIIVIDQFHVCQSVYEKIAKARSKIMAYIGAVLTALRGGEYCGHFAEGDRE